MRCLTITLNAAVDATYAIDRLVPGEAHRVRRAWHMPGGKGNNVARVLAARGHDVTATGFLGGSSGAFIAAGLAEAGIAPAFTPLREGDSRTCHTILDAATGEATEILEAGPEVAPGDAERFLSALPGLVAGMDAVVISGSAPVGIDAPFLEAMATTVRQGTPRMAVDSSGATLAALIGGRPDLLTPNADELATLMDREASPEEQAAFARDDLVARRLAPGGRVLISRGSEGAALVCREGVIRARPPAIRPVNTVGCGDALLAGWVDAWLAGMDAAASLRQAVALGTAAALQPVAGVVDPQDIARLHDQIRVTAMGMDQ
jgi:1-phosphofructokinase family hexose kinase